jgi:hypothetical protein
MVQSSRTFENWANCPAFKWFQLASTVLYKKTFDSFINKTV